MKWILQLVNKHFVDSRLNTLNVLACTNTNIK